LTAASIHRRKGATGKCQRSEHQEDGFR
jgi:hypothetical protein